MTQAELQEAGVDADDPLVRMLSEALNRQTAAINTGISELKSELRSLKIWAVVVPLVAMGLLASVVGVSVKMTGTSFEATGADAVATEASP